MTYEVKKIAKIVDEVLTFFMYNYEAEALIDIKCRDKTAYMNFKFTPVTIDETEFEKLLKRFSSKRQSELENYYWQLAGETEEDNEISLVAMMCDTCEMRRQGDTLEISLTRKQK